MLARDPGNGGAASISAVHIVSGMGKSISKKIDRINNQLAKKPYISIRDSDDSAPSLICKIVRRVKATKQIERLQMQGASLQGADPGESAPTHFQLRREHHPLWTNGPSGPRSVVALPLELHPGT